MPAPRGYTTASLRDFVGHDFGASPAVTVGQPRIDAFAAVTGDDQWIHVDVDRARAESPFGGPVAHGFLTLSLLTHLDTSIPKGDHARFEGIMMGLNYGFEKVRFVSPVKVGSRIRARATLAAAELKGPWIQTTRTMTVEIEGEAKPAMVADWITRIMYS